ncbi:hypothetical protein PF011_g29852, partial [Phytophthora fragariae]
ASATNIESAGWTSGSTGTNSSYYVEMSPSPPRVRRAACVAAAIGGVRLHGVASATNIESAGWTFGSTGTNSSYYVEMSPSPPVSAVLLARSASPRRGQRHQHRVRVLDFRQQHHKLVVLHRNVTVTSRVRRAARVAAAIGGVRLYGVASATNIESASWTSGSTGTNSSYYVEMSPSPPRVRRAACVAAVLGGVSLHAVASATNIESACWTSASSTTNLLYYIEMSPSPPVSAVLLA